MIAVRRTRISVAAILLAAAGLLGAAAAATTAAPHHAVSHTVKYLASSDTESHP